MKNFFKRIAIRLSLALIIFSLLAISPAAAITRSDVVNTSESYINHLWTASKDNVCSNKVVSVGSHLIRIDTPDKDCGSACFDLGWWDSEGNTNQGMPYKWGGFSTLADFDDGIEDGVCGGDVYNGSIELSGYGSYDSDAVGIDCSGFVSRCWNLKSKKSTRSLPNISKELGKEFGFDQTEKYQAMKRGDILNIFRYHVMLCAENNPFSGIDTEVLVNESSGNDWKVGDRKYTFRQLTHNKVSNYRPDEPYIPYIYPYIEDSNFSLADVEIVINRSESMKEGKIEKAKEMTKNFVDFMIPNVRVGVASFNNQGAVNHPLILIGKGDNVKNLAKGEVDEISCSGGSALVEEGLAIAQSEFDEIKSDETRRGGLVKIIFLMSDGSEDQDSLEEAVSEIEEDGIMFFYIRVNDDDDEPLLSIVDSQNSNSNDEGMGMFLRNIAEATGGGYYTVDTPDDFHEFFQDVLNEIYQEKGIKLEEGLIFKDDYEEETMAWIDPDVEKATFSLNWENIGSDLDLVLVQPDEEEINPATADSNPDISFVSGSTYEIYKVDYPMNGEWKLKIRRQEIFSGQENYSVSVSGLLGMDFQVKFDREKYYLGDSIKITASIVDQILDIPEEQYIYGAKVEVEVKDPNGNIFPSFILFDDGDEGDKEADDGIYTGVFPYSASLIEIGNYTFTVSVRGKSNSEESSFERVKTVSAFVSESKNKSARQLKQGALKKLKAFPKMNNRRCQKNINHAVGFIEKSLDEKFWLDDSHLNSILNSSSKNIRKSGVRVFNYERRAVKELLKIIKKNNKCFDLITKEEIQTVINELIEANALLAEVILNEAKNISVENPKLQKKIDRQIKRAEKSIEKAYQELDKNKPDRAIYYFRNSWIHSQIAVRMDR